MQLTCENNPMRKQNQVKQNAQTKNMTKASELFCTQSINGAVKKLVLKVLKAVER